MAQHLRVGSVVTVKYRYLFSGTINTITNGVVSNIEPGYLEVEDVSSPKVIPWAQVGDFVIVTD